MRSIQTVTIGAAASVSSAVDLGLDGVLSAVITDSAWDTAGIQIEGSADGTNYFPVFDNGTLVGVTSAVASKMYSIEPKQVLSARYVRVRSGTSASPVVQADSTTLTIISGHFI